MKILVLNGPNINMLGIREPDIYGSQSYPYLLQLIQETAQQEGITIEHFQSNHEGALVDKIQEAYGNFDGIVIKITGKSSAGQGIDLGGSKAVTQGVE